jgi:hypothetical protein
MWQEKVKVNQPPEYTARILSYEVGDIHKCMIYMDRHGTLGYIGETKVALADAYAMLQLLTEQLGYDNKEIQELAWERFCDCHKNLQVGHR